MASDDPDFESKAADIIGLYLNPPRPASCAATSMPIPPTPGLFSGSTQIQPAGFVVTKSLRQATRTGHQSYKGTAPSLFGTARSVRSHPTMSNDSFRFDLAPLAEMMLRIERTVFTSLANEPC
jgi:hypothetical protein